MINMFIRLMNYILLNNVDNDHIQNCDDDIEKWLLLSINVWDGVEVIITVECILSIDFQ
jgi:hypothetical protein